MDGLEFRLIRKKELAEFLESPLFLEAPILPITRHRAASYLKNPRSSENDPLLFLALWKGRIHAYLGIFPDRIHFGEEAYRAGWLSCMYVDPLLRGKGVAKTFMKLAFENWDDAILVTNFTPAAYGLYQKTERFQDLYRGTGIRAYLKLSLSEIVPRKTGKTWTKTPLQLADGLANLLLEPIHIRARDRIKRVNLEVEADHVLSDEDREFMTRNSRQDFEQRGADDIQWMLDYSWVKQGKPDEEASRYHFTSHSPAFRNQLLRIRRSGKLIGLVHFTLREGLLKLPHLWFDKDNVQWILDGISRFMFEGNAHTLLTFDPDLVRLMQTGNHPFLHLREAQRHLIISRKFATQMQTAPPEYLSDGAADGAFT